MFWMLAITLQRASVSDVYELHPLAIAISALRYTSIEDRKLLTLIDTPP